MLKRAITIVTLIGFIFYLYGCSQSLEITKNQVEEYKDYEIKSIVTNEDTEYKFEKTDLYPEPEINDSLLFGWVKESFEKNVYTIKELKIPISQIRTLNVEKFDAEKTCLFSLLSLGVIVVIGLIWFLSTPMEMKWNKW